MSKAICPHCGVAYRAKNDSIEFYENERPEVGDYVVQVNCVFCPQCHQPILTKQDGTIIVSNGYNGPEGVFKPEEELLYPRFPQVHEIDECVPEDFRKLYKESAEVLGVSPRSSATLSRYLLQKILHTELKIEKRNLEEEIKELENKKDIPSTFVTLLQALRKIANFGAHPKKSTNSGEIMDIEPGEAEVMLEIIEQLFDYIFIKPKRQEEFLKHISDKYGIDNT